MKPDEPKYIVVHTARGAPSWMAWAMYAIFIFNAYLFEETREPWTFYLIGALGMLTTWAFFKTYNSLVSLFNETRVSAAVAAYQQPKEEPQSPSEVPSFDPVHTGAKLTGTDATKVDPGEPSRQERTLSRYALALERISEVQDNEVGLARDTAWSALNHDHNEKLKAEEVANHERESV